MEGGNKLIYNPKKLPYDEYKFKVQIWHYLPEEMDKEIEKLIADLNPEDKRAYLFNLKDYRHTLETKHWAEKALQNENFDIIAEVMLGNVSEYAKKFIPSKLIIFASKGNHMIEVHIPFIFLGYREVTICSPIILPFKLAGASKEVLNEYEYNVGNILLEMKQKYRVGFGRDSISATTEFYKKAIPTDEFIGLVCKYPKKHIEKALRAVYSFLQVYDHIEVRRKAIEMLKKAGVLSETPFYIS